MGTVPVSHVVDRQEKMCQVEVKSDVGRCSQVQKIENWRGVVLAARCLPAKSWQ